MWSDVAPCEPSQRDHTRAVSPDPIAIPQTRYARAGELHIAYQVFGDGPIDLVFVDQWFSNVDAMWDFPPLARLLNQLAAFCRVIVFDKRGTGLSDPIGVDDLPTIEEWIDDLRAVLDDVGSERTALMSGHRRVGDGARLRGHLPGTHVVARPRRRLRPARLGRGLSRGASRSTGSPGISRWSAPAGARMAGRWWSWRRTCSPITRWPRRSSATSGSRPARGWPRR